MACVDCGSTETILVDHDSGLGRHPEYVPCVYFSEESGVSQVKTVRARACKDCGLVVNSASHVKAIRVIANRRDMIRAFDRASISMIPDPDERIRAIASVAKWLSACRGNFRQVRDMEENEAARYVLKMVAPPAK